MVFLIALGLVSVTRADEGDLFSEFKKDPSLGGRLKVTYRATYGAQLFRFRGYRFNFPNDVTGLENDAADELEARRRDNKDQDLNQYLSIRTKDLITPWIDSGYYQGVDTDVSFRFFKDLDGTRPGNESLGTFDSFHGREAFQLRTLNAKIKIFEEHLEVTAGRQYFEAAEWVHFDGGKLRLRGLVGPFGKPIEITAFGGQRVTFYSSIQERNVLKNDVWGGTVAYSPTRDTRIELSDVHFIDNSLRVWLDHRLTPTVDLDVIYRQINEDPESVLVDLSYEDGESDFDFRFEYFVKLGANADDFDFDYTFSDRVTFGERNHAYHLNIGDLEPFHEVTLEARQGLSDDHGVFVGATGHWLENRSNRGVYNTDWYEAWGGVDSLHFPWEGLTGRLTVRYLYTDLPRRREWDPSSPLFIADPTGDGEPRFLGVETLLEQDIARKIAVGNSVEWRLYEYEARQADLSSLWALSVNTYLRWRWTNYLTYYLSYTYERDYRFVNPDFDEVHGVRAQLMLSW